MVAVTAGELSPIVSGLVYCGVIVGCQGAYELRRAQEWTTALARWCDEQPDMVSFTGTCQVHRAEILELHGAWRDALEEARQAGENCMRAKNLRAAAEALYRQGELHRLRRELGAAEEAYRKASRGGFEPQPGLALLRLAQGKDDAAAAAIRRSLVETTERPSRARLLSAGVEILLAVDDADGAREACRELTAIAADYESAMLEAMASHADGALSLAAGDPGAALVALRRAWRIWVELEVPYEAARSRVLVGAGLLRPRRRGLGVARAGERPPGVRGAGRSDRPRPPRRSEPRRALRGDPRVDAQGARGTAAGRGRTEQPGDRIGARDQRAHGRPPRAEHLRKAARVVANRGQRVRVRAQPGLMPRVVRNDHATRRSKLVDPGDAGQRGRSLP